MINCPKCNEMLGDDVHKCPFCRYEITEEDRRNILKEKELIHWEATIDAMAEHAKRTKYSVIMTLAAIVITIVGMMAVIIYGLHVYWFVGLALLLNVACIIISVKLHLGVCPYCEQVLRTHYHGCLLPFLGEYCPHCGGKLR